MKDKLIIGISGKAGSGKDAAADYLVKNYDFWKISYASALKEGIGRGVFGFNNEQLYGEKKEVRDKFWDQRLNFYQLWWRDLVTGEVVQEYANKKPVLKFNELGMIDNPTEKGGYRLFRVDRVPITPRFVLQYAGTNLFRDLVSDWIWINACMRQIQQSDQPYWVIPDTRFPNEAEVILKEEGFVFRVERPGLDASDQHASETSLDDYQGFSGIIHNDGTLEQFYNKLETELVPAIVKYSAVI